MENYNLFREIYPLFKILKPIRLIEMFAGIGSQYQALKNLGVNVEHHKIVEWQVNSIQAYNDIHVQDYTNYAKDKSKEEVIDFLVSKGISLDYNEPASADKLKKKPIEWLSQVYNNIVATNNLVNIMNVKGKDLEIKETSKFDYILTYSFPCQDLSLAGKGNGMSKGSGTRSGLLWEIERILNEIKNSGGNLPQVLLMENVPEAIGTNHWNDFALWEQYLTSLGYSNHFKILNAKDFGVPQNRERVFMVSTIGQNVYEFPQKQELTIKLKDVLEKNVDEKYYLSDEKIQAISQWKAQQDPLENMENIERTGLSPTLTARGAGEEHSGMVLVKEISNAIRVGGRGSTDRHEWDLVPIQEDTKTRIRKLTPRECYRLMGFSDEAFDRAQANQTNTALYHQAGDSIVVNVLMGIFKQMF